MQVGSRRPSSIRGASRAPHGATRWRTRRGSRCLGAAEGKQRHQIASDCIRLHLIASLIACRCLGAAAGKQRAPKRGRGRARARAAGAAGAARAAREAKEAGAQAATISTVMARTAAMVTAMQTAMVAAWATARQTATARAAAAATAAARVAMRTRHWTACLSRRAAPGNTASAAARSSFAVSVKPRLRGIRHYGAHRARHGAHPAPEPGHPFKSRGQAPFLRFVRWRRRRGSRRGKCRFGSRGTLPACRWARRAATGRLRRWRQNLPFCARHARCRPWACRMGAALIASDCV